MKALLFCIIILSITTSYAQSWQYANSFGGSPGTWITNDNEPFNLALDSDENAYLFGTYGELTSFNDSVLLHYNDGARGVFLVKFDCKGIVEWVKVIANTESQHESASWMEIKDDYIYIQGHIYMDPESQIYFLDTMVNGADLLANFPDNNTYPWIPYRYYTYIMKLDLNGNIINYHLLSNYRDYTIMEHAYGLVNGNPQRRTPFHIDNDGNFYLPALLTNYQHSIILCDNEPITDSLFPSETTFPQTYLLKFNPNFDLEWITPVGRSVNPSLINNTYIYFTDMENDNQNNIYITGWLMTSSTIVPTYPVYVELDNDIILETCIDHYQIGFLLKYDVNGNLIWARQSKNFGTNSYSVFESLEVTENNEIYVGGTGVQVGHMIPDVGTIFGDIDTLTTPRTSAFMYTGFIAKYDTGGNYHWVTSPNSVLSFIGDIYYYNEKIYTGVYYSSSLTHGDSIYQYISPNPPYGASGLAICNWDPNGLPSQSLNVLSTCSQSNDDLKSYQTLVSENGNIYTSGTLDSTLFFGTHSVSGNENLKMFVAKYGFQCPIYNDVHENFCYGELYNEQEITSSGDYQFVLNSSIENVDSIVNLHAVVYPIIPTGINDSTFCINETYTLNANSNFSNYEWSTGSLETSQTLSFNSLGTQIIYLTVTDEFNCTSIDTIIIDVIYCNNINDYKIKNLHTFPIPAKSHINVQTSNCETIKEYIIYDMHGKIVLQNKQTVEQDNQIIDINSLATGKYIIYLKTGKSNYIGNFIKE